MRERSDRASGEQLTAVHVWHGPDSTVARLGLSNWAAAASKRWKLDVNARFAGSEQELLEAQRSLPPGARLILCTESERALAAACASNGGFTWLSMRAAVGPPPQSIVDASVQAVRGRGFDGHNWAMRSAIERAAWPLETRRYGSGRDAVADLRLPDGPGRHAVVVLLHGGAWRASWERDLMDALAVDLSRRGYATWNIEYRRVFDGGGWPSTFEDVAAGIDALADIDAPIDLDRVALVGHSAGGQLGLWAAARVHPSVTPALVVSLAGVADLAEAARRGVYERAVEGLMGGMPDAVPEAYIAGSPYERLPLGVPQLIIHGTADLADNIDMNRRYVEAARAMGDPVEMIELDGANHFDVIEPESAAWTLIARELEQRIPPADRRLALHS